MNNIFRGAAIALTVLVFFLFLKGPSEGTESDDTFAALAAMSPDELRGKAVKAAWLESIMKPCEKQGEDPRIALSAKHGYRFSSRPCDSNDDGIPDGEGMIFIGNINACIFEIFYESPKGFDLEGGKNIQEEGLYVVIYQEEGAWDRYGHACARRLGAWQPGIGYALSGAAILSGDYEPGTVIELVEKTPLSVEEVDRPDVCEINPDSPGCLSDPWHAQVRDLCKAHPDLSHCQ